MDLQNGADVGSERRKYERLKKKFLMRYGYLEELSFKDAPEWEGVLLDISGGGLRFLAPESMDVDAQLVIELEFTEWNADMEEWDINQGNSDIGVLKVVGRVVWCAASESEQGKHEVGICFSGRFR